MTLLSLWNSVEIEIHGLIPLKVQKARTFRGPIQAIGLYSRINPLDSDCLLDYSDDGRRAEHV